MQELGFRSDVLGALSREEFLSHGAEILREYFLETGVSIGVNSALMNETPGGGKTPRTSFEIGASDEKTLVGIEEFRQALESPEAPLPDAGDCVFLYPNRWGDSVGFAIRFDGIPPLTSEMKSERFVWTAEFQRNTMPRNLDPVEGNHVSLSHQPVQIIKTQGGEIEVPGERATVSTYSRVNKDDRLMMAAEGEIRRRVERSFDFLHKVAELMKLVDRRSLALEGMYTPSGEFYLIDFSFSRE